MTKATREENKRLDQRNTELTNIMDKNVNLKEVSNGIDNLSEI